MENIVTKIPWISFLSWKMIKLLPLGIACLAQKSLACFYVFGTLTVHLNYKIHYIAIDKLKMCNLCLAVCDLWIEKCHLVWGLSLFPSFAVFKLHGCNLDAQHLQLKNHFSN